MPSNRDIPGAGKDEILAKVEQNECDNQHSAAPLAAMLVWHDRIMPCRIMRISAAGALCMAAMTPPLGSPIALRHSALGALNGVVAGHRLNGFAVAFRQEEAAAFALKAALLALTAPTANTGQYIGTT